MYFFGGPDSRLPAGVKDRMRSEKDEILLFKSNGHRLGLSSGGERKPVKIKAPLKLTNTDAACGSTAGVS